MVVLTPGRATYPADGGLGETALPAAIKRLSLAAYEGTGSSAASTAWLGLLFIQIAIAIGIGIDFCFRNDEAVRRSVVIFSRSAKIIGVEGGEWEKTAD